MRDPSPTLPGAAGPPGVGELAVVAIGIVALAVAMGIGRFAFTPLLPLMLRDGSITPAAGAEWAAANYAGYLVGALTAGRLGRQPRRGLMLALAGIVLTTLAAAAAPAAGPSGPSTGRWIAHYGGAALRFAAGIFSAWALVCASAWCLGELARRGAARLGAWIFTGVGIGITVAGVLAWWGGRQSAAALWLQMGLLAALGVAGVGRALRTAGRMAEGNAAPASRWPPAPAPSSPAAPVPAAATGRTALVGCYGAMGFGYIVPATFLPAMAREQVADPLVFGLTWPLFGLAAAGSVAVAARWLAAWPRRRVWAVAQATMALGTALPLVDLAHPSLALLAASALFVGGTFMVATMAGLQLAREQEPAQPAALLARMTAAFATGQIAGPLLVRLIAPAGLDHRAALTATLALATLTLMASAAWLWRGAPVPAERGPA
jgi:MFS family permease